MTHQEIIHASYGDVIKVNDIWFAHIDKGGDDLIQIPYTDHMEHLDTLLLRYNGKYGIFTLPGDYNGYGEEFKPMPIERALDYLRNKYNDCIMDYVALDDEPFPYDDVRICGMDFDFFGLMAYRKGTKWGVLYFFYVPADGGVGKLELAPCRYSSFEEALSKTLVWMTPSQKRAKMMGEDRAEHDEGKGKDYYRKINREVMTDTKRMYESLPELQAAVRFSIGHQFMVAQEEVIGLPETKECVTQYVTSARRTFEAAKVYKGKKVAVLNFANNHSVGGAPFSAGAQEESLCRCSTLYPCLQAMYGQFYKRHQDEYGRKEINEMGSDDLIYTPDVVVFKTDERTDPQIPRMMEQGEWYKVDVITCAAPELRHRTRKPRGYEEMIRRRIKKILDVAAKEKAEVLILGAWGCGAFGNDIAVVSKAFYSLLEKYNFETVEFALGSTKFFDYFQKGTVVE